MIELSLIFLSYLCGAIPFGLLVGKMKGIDIRMHGSGNIGATNAGRVLGRRYGYLVFALDLLKGLVPTLLACWLVRERIAQGSSVAGMYLLWVIVAAAAILGHMFPVFLRFKGGKGVATSVGAMLGIYPFFTLPALAALVLWVILTLGTRYVSVGSIGASIAFPVLFTLFARLPHGHGRWHDASNLWPFYVACFSVALLVVVRHRSNIARLLTGREPQIGRRGHARATGS